MTYPISTLTGSVLTLLMTSISAHAADQIENNNQMSEINYEPIIQAQENTITTLPTITVTATRDRRDVLDVPTAIYKVEIPDQQNNANIDLAEILQGVPGLQVKNRENFAQDLQLSIRGFGARSTFGVRGIRMYVDGIPATMPDGQGQTSNIDLNSLSNIEVLTGPFSSLYGNSSGGTILTETRTGEGRDSVTVGVGAGSHDQQQVTLSAQGGADQANQPAYYISNSYMQTDGYREHSGADKVLQNAKLTWDLDDGSEINWVVNRVKINADDPQGLDRPQWEANPKQVNDSNNIYNVRKSLDQLQTGLTWQKPISDKQSLYAMTYLGQREMTQYQSIPKCATNKDTGECIPKTSQLNTYHAGGVIDFDRTYYGVDLRWMAEDLFSHLDVALGLAFDRMDEDRQGYENFDSSGNYGVKGDLRRDEDNSMWNLDPYLQASWAFNPAFSVDAGLRYSNVRYDSDDHYIVVETNESKGNPDDSGKVDYDQWLPSAALNWKISDHLNSYIAYGKGFETPTFTEMAYRPDGLSGVNTDLKAATSDTYELGLKSRSYLGLITGALFYTETRDDIVSADDDNRRSTYRNADQTLRQGVELAWQKMLWKDLSLQASYHYIDATFDADIPAIDDESEDIVKGTNIPGIAKNQAYLGLNWKASEGLRAGLDMRYVDQVYVNDENSDVAPSYAVVGMSVGYTWLLDDWQVNSYARVNNLFDGNYVGSVIVNDRNRRYFEPADGRNFSAGLSMTKQF